MTTKPMQIICSWCRGKRDMGPDTLIWNFDDKSLADPIGYCSENCIKEAGTVKELLLKKAGFDLNKEIE
jgi:hypothetical protein